MPGRFSPEFKAKVALEAEKMDNNKQVAVKYSLDQTTVRLWRRQLIQNAASIFEVKKIEPDNPKPVFVWPLTLHKRKVAKWEKRKRVIL